MRQPTTSAEIALASLHPSGDGPVLWSVIARYPRFIHAQVMTYGMIRRNAQSSRAVPISRMIAEVRRDPAVPMSWGSNQRGMQAGAPLRGWRLRLAYACWIGGMWIATSLAWCLMKIGAHKELVNRLIEPWAYITVILTATEWQNFFDQRLHHDAQPDIQRLAECIRVAMNNHYLGPHCNVRPGDWHAPLALPGTTARRETSAAGCARVSYGMHGSGRRTEGGDIAMASTLWEDGHHSPFEHAATPGRSTHFYGPYRGWKSNRFMRSGGQLGLPISPPLSGRI